MKEMKYETPAAFRRALEDRLLKQAAIEKEDVQRLRRKVAFDRFLCRLSYHSGNNWILKGGYAMELRMQTARTTKDIDLGLKRILATPLSSTDASQELLELLQLATSVTMDDFFVFHVGEMMKELDATPDIGMRFPIEVLLSDRIFTRFHVDVSLSDVIRDTIDRVTGCDWLAFADVAPMSFRAIAREDQFAEKLHAYTRPRAGAANSRVKDLVDMVLLIRENAMSCEVLGQAIRDTFERRGTHLIPSMIADPPEFWKESFAAMAGECRIDPNIGVQFRKLVHYINPILCASIGRNIPFSKVDCSGNELTYVTEVLNSGWLTTAGKCAEFENRFVEKVGGRYACAVNSATAALHLACEAIGIGPGDKVFVPTMTFTASAEIIRYLGADPVFLDVEYGTCLITPGILETAIAKNPDAKAIVLVHFGGQAAEMDQIMAICKTKGLKLIEDAAHAFPSRYKGHMIGSFGDATCFSFYANKTITTGEGGMLVTNDENIHKRVKTMRLHGINRDIWDRFTAKQANWEYDVIAPGFKYNMPDVNAAIGLAQMERADAFREGRQRCAEYYYRVLADIDCLDLPICHRHMEDHSWHLFWIVLNERAPIARSAFIEKLNDAGIGTSVHYKPLHRMTYYRERYGLLTDSFPNSEKHWRGVVSLPVYPSLQNEDLASICRTIRKVLERS